MEVPSHIPVLDSVAGLASHYDAWLCDVWGVIHNGEHPFAAAVDACSRFRAGGGRVIFISNSPRPGDGVIAQIGQIGVSRDAWDAVVTSGDVTRALIEQNLDKKLFHLGPERDLGIFTGFDVTFSDVGEAGLVVCTGLHDDTIETPENYRNVLGQLAARSLPMICANPDLMVERGNRLAYCAGALAALYEELGCQVTYAGKPHSPIYERAFSTLASLSGKSVARERVLAIGDGLKTDMAGADRAGIDALFVASGLHLEEASGDRLADADAINRLFAGGEMQPVAAQSRLVW